MTENYYLLFFHQNPNAIFLFIIIIIRYCGLSSYRIEGKINGNCENHESCIFLCLMMLLPLLLTLSRVVYKVHTCLNIEASEFQHNAMFHKWIDVVWKVLLILTSHNLSHLTFFVGSCQSIQNVVCRWMHCIYFSQRARNMQYAIRKHDQVVISFIVVSNNFFKLIKQWCCI